MFEPVCEPRCFNIPSGCDFSDTFVAGLRARLKDRSPEAMARVRVFVNTRRTQRRMVELFAKGPPGFLPQIRAITDLGDDPLIAPDIAPASPPYRRRLELARAVAAMIDAAPHLAPRSSVFDLAASLARLMDEMHGEGVDAAVLETLNGGNHAEHWQLSLEFLNILVSFFSGEGAPGRECRQRLVIERLAEKWASEPPDDPVIVAGSTGSRGATALFMETVAGLPQGAVVLPGLDVDLPTGAIGAITGASGWEHPQSSLLRFLGALGIEPRDVGNWSDARPRHSELNRLVSLALRPAPVTDQWLEEGPKLADTVATTAHLSLIEAPDPRREALAIACHLRAALEDGRKAALVTPDRTLARRVTAALGRWNIRPDDSAGRPLAQMPTGIFLRHVASLVANRVTTDGLIAILKHPLTHSAAARNQHLLRSRDLELELLRGGGPFPDFGQIRNWATGRTSDPHSVAWAEWLCTCLEGKQVTGCQTLGNHVDRLTEIACRLACGSQASRDESDLFQRDDGEIASHLLHDLSRAADAAPDLSAGDFERFLKSLLMAEDVRDAVTVDPRVQVLGTLESRVQGADLVILGGLNDGIWPSLPTPDPWLSRDMRARAGLLLPERQIGLAAHDFQQAVAAPEVVLTRALRDADAPMVASRWLTRLENLLAGLGDCGKTALMRMRARGQDWLDLAAALETPTQDLAPAPRPAPCPPLAARPRKLSVTQIKTLIRDPYAIYARHILRLRPLDPLRGAPDALKRGEAVHKVFETFIERTRDELPIDAASLLMDIAQNVFTQQAPWPAARRQWLARVGRIAETFVADETVRRLTATPLDLEVIGKMHLDDPDFTLTCKADRIDRTPDGALVIHDYKSGQLPGATEVARFDKQLPLEGAIAQKGGFRGIPPAPVALLRYVGIGSEAKTRNLDLDDDLIAATLEGLCRLIRQYDVRETGYSARARLRRRDVSDYDHLSRHGEWDASDPALSQEVP
ncbi:MAG: double-strand break repair protein AddB [Paracoccaceae bacterium]